MRNRIAMRRTSRLLARAFALGFAGALAGCGSLSMPAWDPTDLMDFLDTEKRTPGVRKPVFPEGVPGVTQGVPQHMIRGNAEAQAAAEAQVASEPQTAAAAPPPEAQPAPPPRRSRTAARRAPAEAPVEIAPDDVNVDDNPTPPPRRQQANPFPAPLPR